MVTLEKATADSCEKIYPLFTGSSEIRIAKEDFSQLFKKRWGAGEDYFGYMLVDQGKPVGYLGYIFSQREGKRFCNLTSWNVEPAFRKHSMQLLLPILKEKDCTITTFTGGKTTNMVLNKLGFDIWEDSVRAIPPLLFPSNFKLTYGLNEIESRLGGDDLKIFKDHRGLNCLHVLVEGKGGNCYAIIQRTRKKGIPVGFIHYISDLSVFQKAVLKVSGLLCLKLNVVELMAYERTLKGLSIPFSLRVKLPRPALFKSDVVKKEEVDSLYSEYFLLPAS